jgi:hypothetical protein
MDEALREFVRQRAGHRCEYCRLHQEQDPLAQFQIEHIIAKQHGGRDIPSNLALSCHHCNLHKGPNLTGIDPDTRKIVRLFNPRRHKWQHHFAWVGPRLVGRTAIGRTTVVVLAINDPERVGLREALIDSGDFPPP